MTETIEGLPLADRLAKGIRTLLISGELMPDSVYRRQPSASALMSPAIPCAKPSVC